MFHSQTTRMYRETVEGPEGSPAPLHNVDNDWERLNQTEEATESGAGAVLDGNGTWGERDVGGPISPDVAMQEYDEMRRELTNLSQSRTNKTDHSRRAGSFALKKSKTGGDDDKLRGGAKVEETDVQVQHEDGKSVEQDDVEAANDTEEADFALDGFLRDGYFGKREEGQSAKKVGVVFKHLTVHGVGAKVTFVKTLPHAIIGTFGPDLYRVLSRFLHFLPQPGSRQEKRDLIHDFTGVVRDGEMLLVLGRPGAGCSTFLKAVANKRDQFAGVSGDVSYGGISAEEQSKRFRGEVNYNEEDDKHLPALTVEQTLKFSLLNKTKKRDKGEIPIVIGGLLKMFGIFHTRYTPVGDAFFPGVSGGERKRVSIAETLSTKSTVVSWDNSTRGLDASTALDYAKSLRVMTDVSNRTTIITLYQAGEGIYDLMDKVLLIDQGRMIYQGPAKEAKAYFQALGYYCPERQTTADFLTACTDPIERRFSDGFNGRIPKGSIELERAFHASEHYQRVLRDVEVYENLLNDTNHADARQFKQSVQETKSKTVSNNSNYTVSFFRQVLACIKRELWLTLGDKKTLKSKFFIIVFNALVVASYFFGQSKNTDGAFSRGGALFISILYLSFLQLGELMKSISGRSVIARHKSYAFYKPSAVVFARVVADLPMIFCMVIPFTVIMYFLTELTVDVSKYWIYLLFVYTTTITITALYRMFSALSPAIDDAVRFAGISLILLLVYTGYVIPKPQLIQDKIWFGWLTYINPISYAFEAVISNEFHGRDLACSPLSTIPNGPGYDNPAYQGCAFRGAELGSLSVPGARYLGVAYTYTRSHLWRNWGVLLAFAVLYVVVTALATEVLDFSATGGGALEFKQSRRSKRKIQAAGSLDDVEKAASGPISGASSDTLDSVAEEKAMQDISGSERVLTWENIDYNVPYIGGEKQLLNKAAGYAKPGVMVALMGASGAGKTTLLNVLSQRQRTGVVSGSMLIDGRPLGTEFKRGTGYCEQMDLHDVTATIREALEFSASLRQDRNVPRAEKIAYVDKIIDLLELTDIQDALIRSLGVEQTKRVTIGVELAAKPSLLLFLDEPTSGLDSQSAYNIIRFLKKLALAGQAIICTIHQPSTQIVTEFDMILALNPGGNTFYFGPVGENSSAVIKYFNDRGIEVPPEKNIAEFILETAAKGGKRKDGKKLDWNQEWLNSEENKALHAEIHRLKSDRSKVEPPPVGTQHEFASPVMLQSVELTKRLFKQYWRSPSYLYGKFFVAVVVGIFNGFTYWQLGNTIIDMQNRMFSVFLMILMPPTIVNGVLPKFYMNRALWETRELPSRVYGWFAFCTANVVAEIPVAIVCGTLYWALWYWPAGLPTGSPSSGYVYLMIILFFFFQASWGQWICAFTSSFTVLSNVVPSFLTIFSVFNGVIRPYNQIPVLWRYTLYYINPSTYWIGGVISTVHNNVPVVCAASEAAYFNPPPNTTCFTYASAFVSSLGRGYLTNPDATSNCGFCPYKNGVEYMKTLNVEPGEKWRDFGIFLLFVFSNWFLVYFLTYTVRIRGWTFGFGFLSKVLGTVLGAIAGVIVKGCQMAFKSFKRGNGREEVQA